MIDSRASAIHGSYRGLDDRCREDRGTAIPTKRTSIVRTTIFRLGDQTLFGTLGTTGMQGALRIPACDFREAPSVATVHAVPGREVVHTKNGGFRPFGSEFGRQSSQDHIVLYKRCPNVAGAGKVWSVRIIRRPDNPGARTFDTRARPVCSGFAIERPLVVSRKLSITVTLNSTSGWVRAHSSPSPRISGDLSLAISTAQRPSTHARFSDHAGQSEHSRSVPPSVLPFAFATASAPRI